MQNDGKTEETLVDNSKKADNIVSSQLNDATKPLPPPEAALPRVSISSSKKRVVRCIWPRDPEGPAMAAGQLPHGKVAGNNQRNWGATLNDFYWVQRIPEFRAAYQGEREQASGVDERDWRGRICKRRDRVG